MVERSGKIGGKIPARGISAPGGFGHRISSHSLSSPGKVDRVRVGVLGIVVPFLVST